MRPKASMAARHTARVTGTLVLTTSVITSLGTSSTDAVLPASGHSSASSLSTSGARPVSTTWMPSPASRSAVARPAPLDAPVMTTPVGRSVDGLTRSSSPALRVTARAEPLAYPRGCPGKPTAPRMDADRQG